jgi:DNA-binding CsgD family transcriptional regulator
MLTSTADTQASDCHAAGVRRESIRACPPAQRHDPQRRSPELCCQSGNGAQVQLQSILDCYHDPLLVIDANRRVLFRNAAAGRVLRTTGSLAEKSGHLVLVPARADAALQALIARTSPRTRAAPSIARGIRIARPGAARDWLALIKPLDASCVEASDTPIFLVQIIGRTRPRTAPAQALCDLFGLSRRETAVVTALLRDGSIVKAASRLSVSRETIRSHLKRIFRKCDVHSQDELMSLLHCVSQFAGGA